MNEAQRIAVSRTIDAPVERVFAMLADPDRHRDFDGSGTIRGAHTHFVLSGIGEVFTMDMHRDAFGGDYQSDNLVTSYRRDEEIGWSPGPHGHEPIGHTFTYTLEAISDDTTRVTHTYDWSGVTNERLLGMLPLVSREELAASLDLLADALH
jgi:uncharacterized protein YndB with AHSA1/START domain